MIDWPHFAFNALWILGCAIILATLSYAYWAAPGYGCSTRQLLSTVDFQMSIFIGLGLTASGLFFISRGWLEHILWAALVIIFTWQAWSMGRNDHL